MRKLAVALVLSAVACKSGPAVRPTQLHDLPASDVKNCWDRARNIDTTLGSNPDKPIKLTVFMYVDVDGAVPAAFVHDAQNAPTTILMNCLIDSAVESKFESENADYVRPQPMFFSGSVGRMAQLHDQPPGELDEKLAGSTLQFAGWATPADKGFGYLAAHDYQHALEQFKAAVAAKADDARAQRGLAVALLESGGDVQQARAAAEAAIKAQPDSVAAHEAMARVCLKAKDDKCVLDEWERATIGEVDAQGKVTKPVDEKQKQARSYELAQIQDQVKAVHERFSAEGEKQRKEEEEKQRAELAKKQDPSGCGKLPEGDERNVCVAKYCFGEGAHAYAKELKPLTGVDYSAGEWKASKSKAGKSEVTVTIRAGSKKKGIQPHDATWEFSEDTMKPLTIDANNISVKHNACKK